MSDSLHNIFLDMVTCRNSGMDEEILQDCIDRLGIIMDGKELVPVEPTIGMQNAGSCARYTRQEDCTGIYRAMVKEARDSA